MSPDEIDAPFRSEPKAYRRAEPIAGVKTLRLARHTDDRGFFLEIFRSRGNGGPSEELARFFEGAPIAQLNFSAVETEGHIKGLHYHLAQEDIWFFPPPSKAKIVLLDVRKGSPTSGRTQVVVAGDGAEQLVRIPAGVAHGYRPLTNPCALLYIVTKPFDPDSPDEYRIPWDHPAVRNLWEIPNG
jgi:dTDP-4-dehydrorhamnose 3,5-epimerase